jgi:hypothetical protein
MAIGKQQFVTGTKILVSASGIIISGGLTQILAFYAGFFFTFGYEGLQFFSFAEIKNDALFAIATSAPLFLIIFLVLNVLRVSFPPEPKAFDYAVVSVIAAIACVLLKFNFAEGAALIVREHVSQLWQSLDRLWASTTGRYIICSLAVCAGATTIIIYRTTNYLFKYSILYVVAAVIIFAAGWMRALVLVATVPDATLVLTDARRLSGHLIMNGHHGVLTYDASSSSLLFTPYSAIVSITYPVRISIKP